MEVIGPLSHTPVCLLGSSVNPIKLRCYFFTKRHADSGRGPNVFRRVPIPSTDSSTISPGFMICAGGSTPRCSVPQQPVTVPEVKISPGKSHSSFEQWAMSSAQVEDMSEVSVTVKVSPLTLTVTANFE